MKLQLADLTAVVTGGSSGIGAAIVRTLGEEGRDLMRERKLERDGASKQPIARVQQGDQPTPPTGQTRADFTCFCPPLT